MELSNDDLKKILENISSNDEIKLSDIPSLELYMDQITTLFEDKLHGLKRDSDDKILTKTMVNNYTKAKILMPARSKKYNKQHIILLALIYNLKQTLSINDIHTFFEPIIKDIVSQNENINSLDDIYSVFLEIKNEDMNDFYQRLESKINLIDSRIDKLDNKNNSISKLILLVLLLTNEANMLKRMSEKIIDNFFAGNSK